MQIKFEVSGKKILLGGMSNWGWWVVLFKIMETYHTLSSGVGSEMHYYAYNYKVTKEELLSKCGSCVV